MSQLLENFHSVQHAVAQAALDAKRDPASVRLLAVSKTFPADDVQQVFLDGQRCFGENRVQELTEKAKILDKSIEWHLIGHLQQNKVRAALEFSHWIHAVDTPELYRRIQTIAGELSVHPKLLLEINISGEESKFGFTPEAALAFAKTLSGDGPAPLVGLMTMAPFEAPEEELHRIFSGLRILRDQMQDIRGIAMPELSMGMSGDYPIAIQEGATIVRIGTAIFGHRTKVVSDN